MNIVINNNFIDRRVVFLEGKLRNMTAIYLSRNGKMLMLYRVGSRVVSPSWCGIGGHFEKEELNDAKAAMLREMKEEIGLFEHDIENLKFKYVTLRCKNGEIRQNYYFFANLKENAVCKQQICIRCKSPIRFSWRTVICFMLWQTHRCKLVQPAKCLWSTSSPINTR